jgi:RNA exonuclease 1
MGVNGTVSLLRKANADATTSSPSPTEDHADDANQTPADGNDEKRVKKRKKTPKKESDKYPSISHSSHARLQSFVKLNDLQNLVLYLLADGQSPQWCSVQNSQYVKKVVALMVPGLEAGMFDGKIPLAATNGQAQPGDDDGDEGWTEVKYTKSKASPDDYYPVKLNQERIPKPLQPLGDLFEHYWPIKTPGDDKYAKMHSPLAAMLTVPIVKTKEEKRSKGPQAPAASKTWQNKRTPVTDLLATTEELAEEGYTLHPAHFAGTSDAAAEAARRVSAKTTGEDGWVDTAGITSLDTGTVDDQDIEQGSVTAGRKVFAMDCEMCITSPKGETPQVFSLTRVSVIDWDGQVVLDELVKPTRPITDYLTAYSGITPALLKNVTTTLKDVQQKLVEILTPDSILIGHSLNSDLNALQLTHPYIIDTTLLFPHPRGPPLKSSLKWLAQKYLSREIQKGHGSSGHDSVEDARACLDLVKQKCEKGKAWGTSEASGESLFKRLGRTNRPKRDKINPVGDDEPRIAAVVDWGDPTRGYGQQAKVTVGCESDAEVVAGIKSAVHGDPYNPSIPLGGCDFVWARFRELEAYRGWWDNSKVVESEALRTSLASKQEEGSLAAAVQQTCDRIREVYQALPPCTALLVYSGSADPRHLREMQALQQKFKEEYRVKKWDELSVKWTDVEEQKLRKACEQARRGIGLIAVKDAPFSRRPTTTTTTVDSKRDHTYYLNICLDRARLSPPKPSNFRVGALLLVPSLSAEPLVTGYTLECPGNTHAEQSCFIKLSEQYACDPGHLGEHLPAGEVVLYTTMEPCNKRSVGNTTCVDRILAIRRGDGSCAITKVVVGVKEPETFVTTNKGREKLEEAGVEVVVVEGLEKEILRVAMEGHAEGHLEGPAHG